MVFLRALCTKTLKHSFSMCSLVSVSTKESAITQADCKLSMHLSCGSKATDASPLFCFWRSGKLIFFFDCFRSSECEKWPPVDCSSCVNSLT